MSGALAEWWGFRVRTPLDYDPPPVSRWERTAGGLLLATALELGWWLRLVLGPAPEASGLMGALRHQVTIPALLLLASLALIHILPRLAFDRLGLSAILIVSREKGSVGHWDVPTALATAIIAGVALLRMTTQPWVTAAAAVVLTGGAASLTLALFQPTVDFSKRRWVFTIPTWLRGEADGGTEEDAVVEPDSDAQPVYEFEVAAGAAYKVGIRVPTSVLETLRRLNAESRGALYQREPHAVVLLERPPVDGAGREDLRRFCRQLLSIVRRHALTRLQSANLVLAFVQKAIRYGYDEDTTKDFEGGPYKEYGRFALETIHDGVGDCECTSILCASLLAFLGCETALIHVVVQREDGTSTGHVAAGLSTEGLLATDASAEAFLDCIEATDGSGKRFLYGETACDGVTMPFGTVPVEWKGRMKVESVVGISL